MPNAIMVKVEVVVAPPPKEKSQASQYSSRPGPQRQVIIQYYYQLCNIIFFFFFFFLLLIINNNNKNNNAISRADLTPGSQIKAQNIITNRYHPDQILVGTNERNPKIFDMYRVFYKSGEKYLDTLNPGDVLGWKVEERSFEIRAAVSSSSTCRG